MNFLFYLGIIIPTVITILLFFVFIYCWFLQKARKEVLTKKYDPHGKMRRLGLSMDPPPPPRYCLMSDSLLPEIGEDNGAYDVSRSPSTEQDAHGRPMYQTYHDSGISNCLSPSQESDPLSDFAYRTCPDSGISFGAQSAQCVQHTLREFYQDQLKSHQVVTDEVQVHTEQHIQAHQFHQLAHPNNHPVSLHYNIQPASVHPTHGVCYGDDTRHPQSPQHYMPPPLYNPNVNQCSSKQPNLSGSRPAALQPIIPGHLRLSYGPLSPERSPHCPNQQLQCYSVTSPNHFPHNPLIEYSYQKQGDTARPVNSPQVNSPKNAGPSSCTQCLKQGAAHPSSSFSRNLKDTLISTFSLGSVTQSHSYDDSGATEGGQPASANNERPDSQASQSSTTDSEDSGFRSSHCAAHHKARLSKQSSSLLKPPRRARNKTKDRPVTSGQGNPLITLNPQHLQTNDGPHVIQNTTILDIELAHRPARVLQQSTNSPTAPGFDRGAKYASGAARNGLAYRSEESCLNAQACDNWPPQSTNDEAGVNQNIDLNDISTHLSWKYQQDLSASMNGNPSSPNQIRVVQSCHQGLNSSQGRTLSGDSHMDLVGYSVV
ncbi:unnamed protein product [Lymnaea stagnalis]|uniref:Uncharacterized protein n=1 Tax=Lymnaea stagnalis TaxID=6523 RepID=A0AAV2H8D9_LYMST